MKDLFRQIIDEAKPSVVLTVGTSGGVQHEHDLGDVVVTRGAKFRLADEFARSRSPEGSTRATGQIPTKHFKDAEELMARHADELKEPEFAPPTKRYAFDGPPLKSDPPNAPSIHLDDGTDMPEFHPILTTDFFEFGTSANNLWTEGCAVEMGDAVLGLVADELGDAAPNWAIVRNLSDPMINGDLPTKPRKLDMQAHWAVWYYEAYGYWTSVMGALATWAIIAGLEDELRAQPVETRLPVEVELAYEVMPCQAVRIAQEPGKQPHPCSYFRKWGTYHSYDYTEDVPPPGPGIVHKTRYVGRAPLVPELLSGCRKAPMMALGINPNLPGLVGLPPRRAQPAVRRLPPVRALLPLPGARQARAEPGGLPALRRRRPRHAVLGLRARRPAGRARRPRDRG